MIELLVVMAILAVLASLLLPALASANHAGRKASCISNLRQIGLAIQTYAQDHDGRIPYGPKAPPFTSPASFYPSTGAPTSLLSLQTGDPVGLGLLLENDLAHTTRVFFCPGSDQRIDADAEMAKVGWRQAQGSYYYRHAGNTRLFDAPGGTNTPPPIRLDHPGENRDGLPVRALLIDSQFLSPSDLESFNIKPRTHHRQRLANVLHIDGSVMSRLNPDGRYTMDLRDHADLHNAFSLILSVLERADAAY